MINGGRIPLLSIYLLRTKHALSIIFQTSYSYAIDTPSHNTITIDGQPQRRYPFFYLYSSQFTLSHRQNTAADPIGYGNPKTPKPAFETNNQFDYATGIYITINYLYFFIQPLLLLYHFVDRLQIWIITEIPQQPPIKGKWFSGKKKFPILLFSTIFL